MITKPVEADGLVVTGHDVPRMAEILTDEALAFVAEVEHRFGSRRRKLVAARTQVQARFDGGDFPQFLPETAEIRAADWKVRPAPSALLDRRVEITGPVDRKMVINALNSGANCFMADFEDSSTPTWANMIAGQVNLRDAVMGTIAYENPESGKQYKLADKTAVLLVRPRGLHMEEKHVYLDGVPVSAGFFDFALFLFHNAKAQLEKGVGPYFYLPKMEHYLEARLWEEVIAFAEDRLALPRGSVRVTVLIETITAAFQMDEILYELRDHIVGLNCGRWDYIFNVIKRFARRADFVLPDRAQVTMDQPFLKAYSELLIKTCHRRGAHAMGGMAAQIPIKGDAAANAAATGKVRADKEREAAAGHDGTWVAHPGLIPTARDVFDRVMPGPNQLEVSREDVAVSAADLLAVPEGEITEAGLRANINVGLLYLAAWLDGMGCVPIHNLMEDAATAEISRTQVWQWRTHGAWLSDGRVIDAALIEAIQAEEVVALEGARFTGKAKLTDAAALFRCLVMDDVLEEFLTRPAYELILDYEQAEIC
ncbi:malate synthase A [Kordiimonas marina]|uniref:malate synthase A n=1 Tax=Kordiimonas marina TaxID=2872312 RepID=UPI001FF4F0D2|nr:malate synthase A [Kordiimonas marina]MCJ9430584.1 malate synthase A [Kordiimonas marina]